MFMMKEKIEKMKSLIIKKDDKQKKKIENLVFFLIVLVITLVAINFIFKDNTKVQSSNNKELVLENTTLEELATAEQDDLEQELKVILSKIKGVGEVEVLITYSESSKITPMYNETSNQSITEETDSNGGTRKVETYDSNKEVVSDSNSQPITEKVTMPKIEGAVIIAKGAENTTVKNNIISAVEAATGLSSHKIQVFEMSN